MSVLVPVVFFFPETLRSLVGNGSIPARGMGRTVGSILSQRRREKRTGIRETTELPAKPVRQNGNPVSVLLPPLARLHLAGT